MTIILGSAVVLLRTTPFSIRVTSVNSLVVIVHYSSLCLYHTIQIYNREKESVTLALQCSDTQAVYLDSCRHANVDNPTVRQKAKRARSRERYSCTDRYDLLVRRGQPGLAFGEHDT